MYKEKFDLAKQWVKNSGELLKKQLNANENVQYKTSHQDIVTSYDVLVETMLKDLIHEHFPGDTVIGEESGTHHFDLMDHLWVLDPIDGTVNFVNQKRNYAISIAYYNQEQPVFGIVYDVERDVMYHAYTGRGTFKNNDRLLVDQKHKRLDEMILNANIDWLVNQEEQHNWLLQLAREVRAVRSYGVVSLELCWIADRYIDLYVNLRTYPWDYGAGKIILEEAGGVVRKLNNQPIHINETDAILCTSSEETVLQILEKYLWKEN